jgi:transposase InsO family protein
MAARLKYTEEMLREAVLRSTSDILVRISYGSRSTTWTAADTTTRRRTCGKYTLTTVVDVGSGPETARRPALID